MVNLKSAATPFFLLDTRIARRQLQLFKETFPDAGLYYSLKTNPHKAIIGLVQESGYGFNVCSFEELKLLKSGKVLFYNPAFNRADFEKLRKLGIRRVTVDSEEQLRQLLGGFDVYLRVNLGVKSSSCFANRHFGIDYESAEKIVRKYKIRKLHFHIGSQITELEAWKQMAERIMQLLKRVDVKEINLGGGFPVSYASKVPTIEQFKEQLKPLLDYAKDFCIKTSFETGRFITAEAMKLVTSVKQVKGNVIFLDASVYNTYADILNIKMKLPIKQKGNKRYIIRGCTPDSIDVFGEYLLPELKVGDKIVFESVGAYPITTDFMHLRKPRVVMV